MGEDVTVCLTRLAVVNLPTEMSIADYIQSVELRSAVHDVLSDKEQRIAYVLASCTDSIWADV
jgi:hypothetical protein